MHGTSLQRGRPKPNVSQDGRIPDRWDKHTPGMIRCCRLDCSGHGWLPHPAEWLADVLDGRPVGFDWDAARWAPNLTAVSVGLLLKRAVPRVDWKVNEI